MELRHLRYFVTVAEELHFGRAAARLQMAQPPLSQQIRQLEGELGVALLHRTTHHVALTAAGEAFLEEARRTLAQAEEARRTALRVGSGEVGQFRLGFIGSAAYDVLPVLVRAYRVQFAEVEVVLRHMSTAQQLDALHGRTLDVGILRPPVPRATLATLTVRREPFVVAVPAGHPWACSRRIHLAALAQEPFILFPQAMQKDYNAQVLALCRRAGFEPRVGQEVTEMLTLVGLVAAGLGISLVPASTRNLLSKGVVYRPLQGAQELAELVLAWRREDASEVVNGFLSVVRHAIDSKSGNVASVGDSPGYPASSGSGTRVTSSV
jgi:DNA-binding transcriptional LysR family regulator